MPAPQGRVGPTHAVVDRIEAARVLPVVTLDDPASAAPLADALAGAGLGLAEVALRTPQALAALAGLAGHEDLYVGAGTVVDADQVDAVVSAGARFVVSPGLSTEVVRRCRALSVPVFPGIATASELMTALDLGVDVCKLFPAEQLGGAATVAALAGPFPQARFIPTGGITAATAPAYLAEPAVVAVGGSWMAPRDLIRNQQWAELGQER